MLVRCKGRWYILSTPVSIGLSMRAARGGYMPANIGRVR
jgi:hypothetical protein